MGRIVEPPDVKRIFNKSGCDWTPEEYDRVQEWLHENVWLYEDQQPGYLLFFALHHLGHRATAEDAEDAWGDFCVKGLDAVIDSYDPAKGRRFWNYLLLCFERFCWDKGEKIRKPEASLGPQTEDEEGERIVLELVDDHPDNDPEKAVEREGFIDALNGCLEALDNPNHRAVFVLRDTQNLSEKETAAVLDVSKGSVKGWLHRARQHLADCLQKKGWTP